MGGVGVGHSRVPFLTQGLPNKRGKKGNSFSYVRVTDMLDNMTIR